MNGSPAEKISSIGLVAKVNGVKSGTISRIDTMDRFGSISPETWRSGQRTT